MCTSTNWPIRRGLALRKLTMRLFSVRPWSMPGSFLEKSLTRMRWMLPTIRRLISKPCWWMRPWSICRRCFFTSSGVSSTRSAAGVPGREL
ncbi:hypothetical protein D3C81_2073030 [compost metagenome]